MVLIYRVLAKAIMFDKMRSNKFNFLNISRSLHTQTGTQLHKELISLTPAIKFSKLDHRRDKGSWFFTPQPTQGEMAMMVFYVLSIILQLHIYIYLA